MAGPAAGSLEALWDEWWGGITGSRLVPPASTRVPADAPARLRGLQDGLRLPYARWAAERRAAEVRAPAREVFKMQDAVHRVQRELGTEGLAFELVIEEVPVEGVLWRRLSPGFVLASTSMLHSPLAVDALAAVVRELVAP
ncbi:hypothetical protein [Saccharothrix obliqua]|uniref:hypothetical protein n=1 Tax=Saccharothrix obliqua TaxID=2861747 RepID=UPI001C5FB997|nr:hypothetical protein [Saccharothrix obliqua]MBW4721365.1 hypothetical protein [Saccharothrix obliqua]